MFHDIHVSRYLRMQVRILRSGYLMSRRTCSQLMRMNVNEVALVLHQGACFYVYLPPHLGLIARRQCSELLPHLGYAAQCQRLYNSATEPRRQRYSVSTPDANPEYLHACMHVVDLSGCSYRESMSSQIYTFLWFILVFSLIYIYIST